VTSIGSPTVPARRLPAAERRIQILEAAKRVLDRDGPIRFSLEDVARDAGVATTLPRHYFGSRDALLVETLKALIRDTFEPLVRRDPALALDDRLRLYIRQIDQARSVHTLWLGAEFLHPEVEQVAEDLRRDLISLSFGPGELSTAEHVRGAGWIGFVGASVAEWIARESRDESLLLEILLEGARRFGVRGA
jgi:AcrR family transcriptional regulator